jgi:hypothetical protein
MTTNEIKAFFVLRGISINEIALALNENRPSVSNTIHYIRRHQRIRNKLTKRYGVTFDESIKCRPAAERKAA